MAINEIPFYQNIAAVNGRFVNITAGMRKEQVASAFAGALAWNAKQKKEFLTPAQKGSLPLPEGSFSPGIYLVTVGTTPLQAQALVNERFYKDILSRYATTSAQEAREHDGRYPNLQTDSVSRPTTPTSMLVCPLHR